MKAMIGFWVLMVCILVGFIFLTLNTNPQRSRYQHPPAESRMTPPRPGPTVAKTWKKVYAELYGPKGLEKTWEIATPKGYFNEADRDRFLQDIPGKKQFGDAQVTVMEDEGDLVFNIYYKGAKP